MRRRILVVDDEPGMLRAVQRILEQGYEVVCASSPEDALVQARRLQPDLAILDIRMPGFDGFELMARLKQDLPDLDFILMTGSVGEGDQKLIRAIRQKAFYFIEKPFDREVLHALVERCLELRRLGEENRRHLQRLEGELGEARAFQTSLLPEPQAVIGSVRLCARHIPCDELCGDFYDYAATAAGELGFLVADVSGHGASAAMLTGVVKSTFQSCHAQAFEPLIVTEKIWAAIRSFEANRFVTTFCGRLQPARGLLEYVNAGHPPALLWEPEGQITPLAPTGPLISPALGESSAWQQKSVRFTGALRLLVYTDGVTEAQGEEGFFGQQRLEEMIAGSAQGGAPLLETLVGAVTAFAAGRRLRDDLTLLTVELA